MSADLLLGALALVSFLAFRVLDHDDLTRRRRYLAGVLIVGSLTIAFWAHHGWVGLVAASVVLVVAWVTSAGPLS